MLASVPRRGSYTHAFKTGCKSAVLCSGNPGPTPVQSRRFLANFEVNKDKDKAQGITRGPKARQQLAVAGYLGRGEAEAEGGIR